LVKLCKELVKPGGGFGTDGTKKNTHKNGYCETIYFRVLFFALQRRQKIGPPAFRACNAAFPKAVRREKILKKAYLKARAAFLAFKMMA